MTRFGVIGGSGLYDIPGFEVTETIMLNTPYGDPSDVYRLGTLSGKEIAFLPRHHSTHTIQPHRINYRANIWGFREMGVSRILSVGATGGISRVMTPGVITVPDQIIDFTSGRSSTFFEEDEVVHVDFTDPLCPDIRKHIEAASVISGVTIAGSGTYICVNGPRLETASEIKAFSGWGADMVGMTLMPEASLARELELCLANISVITNFAAGISQSRLTTSEVVETMHSSMERLKALLAAFFALDFGAPSCSCGQALKDAKM